MLYPVLSRIALQAVRSALSALSAVLVVLVMFDGAPAHAQSALKTRNVVLIVSDGLRWQEIFSGADPTLLNETNGGTRWPRTGRSSATRRWGV